jgi:uncharacterized delta-60 repeat protein/gliding motility-associated-like protein
MRKLFIHLLFTITLFVSKNTYAQDGNLDVSFDVGTGAGSVLTTTIQSDGKIILGGYFISYNGIPINHIARVNMDGTLDASFNVGTGVDGYVYASALQSDGKIIIVGYFSSYDGTPVNNVARLNMDGSLDASFNVGMGTNGEVHTVAIQSDGEIIIGGHFSTYNGIARTGVACLNADGGLNATFNIGTGTGGFYSDVLSIVLQSDGKIIIGGGFTTYNGTAINNIARLNKDGSLDASFNSGIGSNSGVNVTALQSDGKVIMAGFFYFYNGITGYHVFRLNTDGSPDASFNIGNPSGFYYDVRAMAIQCDKKIIIGGNFTTYNGVNRNRLVRLNSNGSIDTSFNVGTGLNDGVETIAVQSDGKVIIGGYFTSYNDIVREHLARISVNYFNPSYDKIIYLDTCFGENTKFSLSNIFGYDSLRWDFSDLNSNTLNNSALINPVHKFTSNGSYNVSLTVYSCNSSNTISKQLFIKPLPQINLGNDTMLCAGGSLKLDANPGFSQYLWSNSSTNNYILVKTSGKYWARVTDNGCVNSDTVNVNFIDYPFINLGRDTTFCTDADCTLNPDNNNSLSYLWSDNSFQSSLNVNNSGKYWVRASNGDCISSDTINIIFDEYKNLLIDVSKDTVGYLEQIQFLVSGVNMLSYKWYFDDGTSSDFQNSNHTFMESGNYNVLVEGTNINNCIVTRNVPIVVREVLFIPNLITPNNDNLNDDFKIKYNGKEEYQLEIFNRWGEQVFVTREKPDFWKGENASEGIYYYNLGIGPKVYRGWIQLIK